MSGDPRFSFSRPPPATPVARSRSRRGGGSAPVTAVEWLRQQWNRYDTLVGNYARQADDTARKALCLAFVRSVLADEGTASLMADALFEATTNMMSDCAEAVGVQNVSNTRAQLLFLLWSLPHRAWRRELYDALRDYFRRDAAGPVMPFGRTVGSILRTLALRVADPLTALLRPWLQVDGDVSSSA